MTPARPLAVATFGAALFASSAASAFCGFYVAGADAKLSNDATMTVLMRDGTRTVLSLRPRYDGPPNDFAMVVPVPVVLQQSNVKILPAAVFDRLDTLTAPRLVEYWERDPCYEASDNKEGGTGTRAKGADGSMARNTFGTVGVIVEAQFEVGEYEIVILSARDSTGLDRWLRDHDYKIPEGAEPLLRPYVAAGSKFFVAKVDTSRVVFGPRGALLSPLRVHYDDESFRLPIRLGLLNSPGTQDLVVLVLAQQRYELANYDNLFAPTNLDVADAARARFGELYAAIFDRALGTRKGAAVTEYAWDSHGCDPCPTPPVTDEELRVLGADVVPAMKNGGVLTRLHMRYGRDVAEDLVFRAAKAVEGGDEAHAANGDARPASRNAFQARYVIRHRWPGPVSCAAPEFGVWGGPPDDQPDRPVAAKDIAAATRGAIDLSTMIRSSSAGLGLDERRARLGGAFARGAAYGAALACAALAAAWRLLRGRAAAR